MVWQTIDRKQAPPEPGPGISDAAREKIRSFFPRYETKRAAILPALHIAQDEIGYISPKAMRDIAELLGITPADVMDVVTFYTHFWTHPKGRKVIVLCRSITCQLMGCDRLQKRIEEKLGIGEHETTPDGQWSFMTEECLARCDHAPCLLINERTYKRVTVEELDRILEDPDCDKLEIPRSDLYDAPGKEGRRDEG